MLHKWGFSPKVPRKRFVNTASNKEKKEFKKRPRKSELTNPAILTVPPAVNFYNHLLTTRRNDTARTLTDVDIHNGAQVNYDILLIFHEEYKQAYDNFQSFVTQQGGVLVAMDGNIFFAKVSFNPANNTATLVSGHYWRQVKNDRGKMEAIAGPGEYWKSNTALWFGSNSDAAPNILHFAYLDTTLEYNPFGYPVPPHMKTNITYLTFLSSMLGICSTARNTFLIILSYASTFPCNF